VTTLRHAVVAALLLVITLSVRAQENQPALHVPVADTPQMVVFAAWHAALVSGDFDAFQKQMFWAEGATDDLRHKMFTELRKMTPTLVKVTEPSHNPNGSIMFYAIGCRDNLRLGSLITMRNEGSGWLVAPSLWGLPWNEQIARSCPV
jgi:hypothetical protein